MADEQSTTVDEAPVDAPVDTSVDVQDTTDTTDDVDLEDIEVTPEELGDTDPDTTEATEEEATDEPEEDKEVADTDEPSEDETETEDEIPAEDDSKLSDDQKQAKHNKEMFEQRQKEKQARIQRVKQDQANYIAEASENRDPLELAVRQLQVTEYNNTVEAVSNKLTNGYERALKDFDVLRDESPEIQAEINDTIDAFQAMHVKIDAYGNPTAVTGDLYATLQAKADSIAKLTGIRAANQVKNKSKEKSKTLTTPNRAPRKPKVDPDLAAFDEEAAK